ncbi:META domain-containing protein [Yoonia sp.]|uniref:META domain-containing protein n=1 Tax=Yoonia sp. TaxID=2212373 RepID=UPI00391D41A7
MRRLPLFLTVLVLFPLAGMTQDMRSITGQLRYLDRMALPEDATVLVEVTGADGALVSETRQSTSGQQVPLPFAVDVTTSDDVFVRAGIALGADMIWLGDPVLVMDDAPLDLVLHRYQPLGFSAAYRCGAQMVRTGSADDALVMDTGTARIILQAVATASGARYDASDDSGSFFWSRGDSALVAVDGVELPECQLSLPPVSDAYVARGNEPFWTATVAEGVMTITRLGQSDLAYPVSDAGLQADGAIFVTADTNARLLRDNRICHDDMSGMPFPETVTLTLGNDVFTGCGGDARDLLTGRTWVVTETAGAAVPEDIRVTLGFDIAGRVAGGGGCNRWFAGYELSGEGLRFTQAGATRMACAADQMAQEQRFFDALEQVSGFEIDADGGLVLLGMAGQVIRAQAATDGSAP